MTSSKIRSDVVIYAAPKGAALSDTFSVAVNGQDVPVYTAKVPVSESVPRLNRASLTDYGLASFAYFDMGTSVTITVSCPEAVQTVKILPTSYGIVTTVSGNSVTFTLDTAKQVTVEINGDWHESLHIFANPLEEDVPDPDDPQVVYFGPGMHEVSKLVVGDNTTVYIAGGAVVKAIKASDEEKETVRGRQRNPSTFMLSGKNVAIRGRGIIEGGTIVDHADRRHPLEVCDSENVVIEGIIFNDPSHWCVPIRRCDNVHVDNIKIFGWRGNSDGVDICSSRDVLVENCFMRTFDDLVVIKSHTDQGVVRNVHVRKCVLWNELAHALSIGAEIREDVSNVLFEDCDVIHDVGRETALRIYHCDDAIISNVTFLNIRVEEARRLISMWIGSTRWTKTPERGHIKNVLFKDITATSAPIDPSLTGFQDGPDWKTYIIKDQASVEIVGFDADHIVENALFETVLIDRKPLTAEDVMMNDYAKDIRYA